MGRGEQLHDELPPLPEGTETRGVGSVAYRLALLAQGQGNAVLSGSGRAEWDVAAGLALCRLVPMTKRSIEPTHPNVAHNFKAEHGLGFIDGLKNTTGELGQHLKAEMLPPKAHADNDGH